MNEISAGANVAGRVLQVLQGYIFPFFYVLVLFIC
jgi:hypothetical protein